MCFYSRHVMKDRLWHRDHWEWHLELTATRGHDSRRWKAQMNWQSLHVEHVEHPKSSKCLTSGILKIIILFRAASQLRSTIHYMLRIVLNPIKWYINDQHINLNMFNKNVKKWSQILTLSPSLHWLKLEAGGKPSTWFPPGGLRA